MRVRQADLNILCWEGYDERSLLAPFEKEHNITALGEPFFSDFDAATRLAGPERGLWDVININNPFVQDFLYPRGLIRPLDRGRYDPYLAKMLPQFETLQECAFSRGGRNLLGVCQRFGPFNLVVDTKRISATTAEDLGFCLADDPSSAKRFGILSYDDFNVFHVAIATGLDPFRVMDERAMEAFSATATRWFRAARIVTCDCHVLNEALVRGEIDFYISGGVYTCSAVRLAGHRHIRSITPRRGPIAGRGGIAFTEVTAVVEREDTPAAAEEFIAYLLRPETATRIALGAGGCNPVMQMGDPAVMRAFSAEHLNAIQWDSLEEDVGRCVPYALSPQYELLHRRLKQARHTEGWG